MARFVQEAVTQKNFVAELGWGSTIEEDLDDDSNLLIAPSRPYLFTRNRFAQKDLSRAQLRGTPNVEMAVLKTFTSLVLQRVGFDL